MPQPQPGNLDHGRSQPRIAGLGDALLPMDRSALPRRGGQPRISRNLLPVVERAEQAFRPERGGRLGSNDGVDAPRRHRGAKVVVLTATLREASVTEVSTIGLDLAKNVFQAHGASASGAVLFRKRLRRDQVLAFFAAQPRCLVAMEACASAHTI